MNEMLERIHGRRDSADGVEDSVESYWLPHDTGYYVKLDVNETRYTISWETNLPAIAFINAVLEVDGIEKETARGKCTIDGETIHLEMGHLPNAVNIDGYPEQCTYCKAKDEIDGWLIEVDWVDFNDVAQIELSTEKVSPVRFSDFIHATTSPETIDDETVETVIQEAEKIIQAKLKQEG